MQTLKKDINSFILKDGTVCYTKRVRYPGKMLKSLKKMWFEDNFKNMTETIAFCIESHSSNKYVEEKIDYGRETDYLTIRFREKHYNYVMEFCEKRGVDNFSNGLVMILSEVLY